MSTAGGINLPFPTGPECYALAVTRIDAALLATAPEMHSRTPSTRWARSKPFTVHGRLTTRKSNAMVMVNTLPFRRALPT